MLNLKTKKFVRDKNDHFKVYKELKIITLGLKQAKVQGLIVCFSKEFVFIKKRVFIEELYLYILKIYALNAPKIHELYTIKSEF